MTEAGVVRITGDDFWAALEDYAEYVAAADVSAGDSPLQVVTANAGAVVHIGSSQGSSFAATGPAASVNVVQSASADVDLADLAHELELLRESLPLTKDRETQLRAGALAEAEAALERGDALTAAAVLKRSGAWILEAANKVGLGLLEAFLRQKAGL